TRRGSVEMPRTITMVGADSYSRGRLFAPANSTQSCRRREALLSSGTLCLKFGTLSLGERETSLKPSVDPWTSDETAADQFGAHSLGGKLRGVRGAVAACARGRPAHGRAG